MLFLGLDGWVDGDHDDCHEYDYRQDDYNDAHDDCHDRQDDYQDAHDDYQDADLTCL